MQTIYFQLRHYKSIGENPLQLADESTRGVEASSRCNQSTSMGVHVFGKHTPEGERIKTLMHCREFGLHMSKKVDVCEWVQGQGPRVGPWDMAKWAIIASQAHLAHMVVGSFFSPSHVTIQQQHRTGVDGYSCPCVLGNYP